MSATNRAALITRTIKVIRKYFKPVGPPPKDRTLLEHLLFACLLEDSPYEPAEQVFNSLKQDYFGWNEVRVSTIRELTDLLKPLVNPAGSAERLKQSLHSVFESVYQFDIETLKKQNIGAAVKQLQKYNGTTPFVVSYVTQMALGGHAIPVNNGLLISLHTIGVITDDEFKKNLVPGLERAVPKNKGHEIASLLHQFGVEIGRNPYGTNARKLLLEIAPDAKDRLPKRQTRAPEPPPAPIKPAPAPPTKAAAGKASAKSAAKQAPAAKHPEKQEKQTKKPVQPKPQAAKKTTKKPTKKPTKKGAAKATGRGLAKRKPR